jgi:hypothetical protein
LAASTLQGPSFKPLLRHAETIRDEEGLKCPCVSQNSVALQAVAENLKGFYLFGNVTDKDVCRAEKLLK